MGAYAISKTAMLGLCKVMAKPCADKNIRVNVIAPGLIKTRFSEVVSILCYAGQLILRRTHSQLYGTQQSSEHSTSR